MEKTSKNLFNFSQNINIRNIAIMAFVLFFYVFLLLSGYVTFYSIFAILVIFIAYLFKEKIWLLVVLAIPGLIFGTFIFLEIKSGWVYEASLAEVFLTIALVVFILDSILNFPNKKIKVDYLALILTLYFILSLASFFYIKDFKLYIAGVKVIFFIVSAYFLALNLITTKERMKYFLWAIGGTVAYLSAQILFKFAQTGFSSELFYDRSLVTIPMGAIATISAILVFGILILLGYYFSFNTNGRGGLMPILCFGIGALAIFLTLSKGAIIGLCFGLLFIFFRIKEKRLIMFILAGLTAVTLYVALAPFMQGLFERASATFTDANTQARLREYKVGWQVVNEYPIFGLGAGQQMDYYRQELNLDSFNLVNNYLLQAAVDYGLVGLAIVLSATVYIFFRARKLIKLSKNNQLALGFAAALIGSLFLGLVEVTYFALPYAIVFWISVGAFSNLPKMEKA